VKLAFCLFTLPPPPWLYTLPLHAALPISPERGDRSAGRRRADGVDPEIPQRSAQARGPAHTGHIQRRNPPPAEHGGGQPLQHPRSEEHTSELQSRENLVCRLLLEKKNK